MMPFRMASATCAWLKSYDPAACYDRSSGILTARQRSVVSDGHGGSNVRGLLSDGRPVLFGQFGQTVGKKPLRRSVGRPATAGSGAATDGTRNPRQSKRTAAERSGTRDYNKLRLRVARSLGEPASLLFGLGVALAHS